MAITIPANTVTFLTKVKNDLSLFSNLNTNGAPAAPANFIRSQDMANVLRLLQAVLGQTSNLTAVGAGSTTTVVDGASTFVAGSMVGYEVTFTGGTALNIGQKRTVISNTTTTLTFAPALPAATATSDTYTLRAAFVDSAINAIMQNKDPATTGFCPAYPEVRLVQDALVKLLVAVGGSVSPRVMLATTAVASTSTTVVTVNTLGVNLTIDQFKGMQCTVASSGKRRIVGNTENKLTLDAPITAPSGGETVTVGIWPDDDSATGRCINVLAGGQPRDNSVLATLIDTVQTAIAAWTNPS